MRFISILVVLAVALWPGFSHGAAQVAPRPASADEAPLLLKPASGIELLPARDASADAPQPDAWAEQAIRLQPDAQLSDASVLAAVSGRSFGDETPQDSRPWFNRVRPLLEMAR